MCYTKERVPEYTETITRENTLMFIYLFNLLFYYYYWTFFSIEWLIICSLLTVFVEAHCKSNTYTRVGRWWCGFLQVLCSLEQLQSPSGCTQIFCWGLNIYSSLIKRLCIPLQLYLVLCWGIELPGRSQSPSLEFSHVTPLENPTGGLTSTDLPKAELLLQTDIQTTDIVVVFYTFIAKNWNL